MKKLGLLVVLSMAFSAVSVAAEMKVGVVDLQKALQTVKEGKAAKSKLEAEFKKKKAELQKEEAAIKKMTEDFKKKSLVLTQEAKMKKQQEIQERLIRYRELFGKSEFDFQNRQRKIIEPILLKLRKTVGSLAKSKKYTLVLEKNENNVLFSLPSDDLTAEVIKIYDKK